MNFPEGYKPKAGDILLYLNFGWMGAAISWFSWTGKPGEALEYSHIALVLNEEEAVEMNPPKSRRFPLSEVPWDRVHIFRVGANGLNPFDNSQVVAVFQAEAIRRLGEIYGYGFIAQAAGLGILARIGLGGLSRWILSRNNPAPSSHTPVCSIWAEQVERFGIRSILDQNFDFFPDLGEAEIKPSDWPLSPYVKRLKL